MINYKIKYTVLLMFIFLATGSLAMQMSVIETLEIQQVNISNSTVIINGKIYSYSPVKKISKYQESKIQPLSIRSLKLNREYYIEIQQDLNEISANSNDPEIIIFITEEKLPE